MDLVNLLEGTGSVGCAAFRRLRIGQKCKLVHRENDPNPKCEAKAQWLVKQKLK